jgi:hypothetical protein
VGKKRKRLLQERGVITRCESFSNGAFSVLAD